MSRGGRNGRLPDVDPSVASRPAARHGQGGNPVGTRREFGIGHYRDGMSGLARVMHSRGDACIVSRDQYLVGTARASRSTRAGSWSCRNVEQRLTGAGASRRKRAPGDDDVEAHAHSASSGSSAASLRASSSSIPGCHRVLDTPGAGAATSCCGFGCQVSDPCRRDRRECRQLLSICVLPRREPGRARGPAPAVLRKPAARGLTEFDEPPVRAGRTERHFYGILLRHQDRR